MIPTVWLQEHYLSPGAVHWYDAAATLVYVTHFLATPVMAAVLWLRNRELWLAFVRRVLALAVAGLITYVLYPGRAPWYAVAGRRHRPGGARRPGAGWFWLHINHAGNLLQEGQAASNPVAAMPSLHTGYATIIALFVLSTVSSRFAWLMLLYPGGDGGVAGVPRRALRHRRGRRHRLRRRPHSAISWWERWYAEPEGARRAAPAGAGSELPTPTALIHHRGRRTASHAATRRIL